MYKKERSMRDYDSYPQRRRTQSFSSSLLDSIYRSIDESKSSLDENQELGISKQSDLMEKQSGVGIGKVRMNLRRAVMMEDWMEKQSTLFLNSATSSSSECSYGGRGGGPISPGSRIASFLSSIFNSGNVKKAKMCYVGAVEDVRFDRKSKSPCFSVSSASSFSRRSCMSSKGKKNSSSNNNVNNKRCVRFYPVSVILGETQNSELPYGQSDLPVRKFSRSCSIKKLKSSEKSGKLNFRGIYDDDEEDDDGVSCSSSDLFELDHLVGGGRYQEELPVYETTDLETNKAIANGLHL
ncbi:protein BIG GRAIN 1-like C [Senna tora]|uniref:Protein BIG GRAIN 1-like C n=1 Tax=Senna tora TaxID=362788 RepID=A0A834T2V8_9FABA|nr:protein BIG GRAIN 1-like C [Senna tora]